MVLSMQRWVNKVAVVTGASSGIGAAIAERLVKEGLLVVGLARRKEKLDLLRSQLQGQSGEFHAFKADISKEDDVLAAFAWIKENLGPVHILINNAALARPRGLIDGETEFWRDVLNTNVIGLCVATREAIKNMRANSVDGHIVHINSISGHKVPNIPEMNVYPASKHGVTALTETLRLELIAIKSNIKITSVSPGCVNTEFGTEGHSAPALQKVLASSPLLQVEDITDAVVIVLSTPPHVQVHELTIKPVGEAY